MTTDVLTELKALIAEMTPEELAELDEIIAPELSQKWLPNPGPQTTAYISQADLMLYGGAGGGGKTDLIVGLCANDDHERAVVFRRSYGELSDIGERFIEVMGTRQGWNGSDMLFRRGSKLVEFGALEKPGSEKAWRGRAHDLICFDEGGELSVQKVSFVMGWNRSTKPGQRCRVIIASNPPSGSDGQWLIEWFAPWVDPLFPNPALPGELRWAYYDPKKDCTVWVDGPGETKIDGEEEPIIHKSRTFVPALLNDNPYLRDTDYRATLQGLPEPLRSQLLKGDFLAGREDHEWQVIPSEWVKQAQERWKKAPQKRRQMLALAADVALAKDWTVLAPLYTEGYFGNLIKKPGAECSEPATIAQMMLAARQDACDLSVDGTGGWGSGVKSNLKTAHDIECASIVFSKGSESRTADGKLGFYNLRAQMYWRLREALDPETGDDIMLPPDAKLAAQLTAHRYKIARKDQIQIEDKEEVKARVGSSPDESDAVVMAWHRRKAGIKRPLVVKKPAATGSRTSWMGV